MIFLSFSLILSGIFVGVIYDFLLSREKIVKVTGPEEGYYWTAAQYQLVYNQVQYQLLLYATGEAPDFSRVAMRMEILISKFNILANPSDYTNFFKKIPHYQVTIDALRPFMNELYSYSRKGSIHTDNAKKLIARMNEFQVSINEMSVNIRHFEIDRQEQAFSDFYYKRRLIFAIITLIALVSVVWFWFLTIKSIKFKGVIEAKTVALQNETIAKSAAEASVQAQNLFLAMIGHEFRTPLQTISSSVELLSDHVSIKEENIVKRLKNAADRLENQVQDLTDYTKLNSGTLRLIKSEFDPDELVKNVMDDLRNKSEIKGLSLTYTATETNWRLISDQNRIRQILYNIVNNSIRYTGAGYVNIAIRCGADFFEISVADTGIGMSRESIPKIFDPFIQIENSNVKRYDGIGMGLAIVKLLVNLLNGKIDVSSELGKGSIFEITIPADIIHISDPNGISLARRKLNVLVVDDNIDLLEDFKGVLNSLSVICETISNPDMAIKLTEYQKYDAILMDIQIPNKDGFTVTREIANGQGVNKKTPVIAITGGGDYDEQTHTGLFFEWLTKPVHKTKIIEVLNRIVSIQ